MRIYYAFVLFPALVFGQQIIAPTAVNGNGQPWPQLVTICTANPGGNVCSAKATTYTDITASTTCSGTNVALNNSAAASIGTGCSNPGFADNNGNVVAFAAAGSYWCQFSGAGIIPYSRPCPASGSSTGNPIGVAVGSQIVSSGINQAPIYQTKPVFDVRDYGVTCNGSTDDTTAFQNAINAACGSSLGTSAGATIAMPNSCQLKISSTIVANSCGGLVLDGNSSTGQAGFGAQILWAGGNGGTVFSVNRTRDSIFRNFSIGVLNASNIFNICFDLDENSGSGILSHNLYQNIQCALPGSAQNSSFVGIRIGKNAPGNTEQQVFEDVDISCGGGTLTDTSNGRGFQINVVGGSAQPFYIPILRSEISGCSHGVEVSANARQIIIDGGNYGSNFRSVYLNAGNGVVIENLVTTADVSSSIYLNGYASTLEVRNNSFTGGGAAVIDITNASSGAKITVENNDFGGIAMFNGTDLAGSYSGYLYVKGNWNFVSPCPTQAIGSFLTAFRNIPTSGTCDEVFAGTSGSMAFDFASRNDGVNNSPPVRFEGAYQNSATPTYATDYWQWQDVVGSGTNGTSTYTLTHSGSTGALLLDLSVAPVKVSSSTFANLPSSANGTVLYCSDCNSTCSAGSSTGRTCFRENGAWTH